MITSHIIGSGGRDAWNKDLVRIYERSFPKNEKIPYKNMLELIESATFPIEYLAHEEGGGLFLGEGDLVGLSVVAEFEDFDCIWYLAVREICREKGYGEKIFQIAKHRSYDACYKEKPLLIEIKHPLQHICNDQEERVRRHKFFLEQGFKDTNIIHEHAGNQYLTLTSNDLPFNEEDYNSMLEILWKARSL